MDGRKTEYKPWFKLCNRVRDVVLEAKHIDNLNLAGLSKDRKPVFAGGLSIVIALFELFAIEEMSVSEIALREGVLYDFVGRASADEIRCSSVATLQTRWSIEIEHAERVRVTAAKLFEYSKNSWVFDEELYGLCLEWAAQLHEIGLLISHDAYHKHGAYITQNADMAGFARRDQLLLSALILGHRRKFPLAIFNALPPRMVKQAKRIAVLLRLSVLLHRGRERTMMQQPNISADFDGESISLAFASNWLEAHPLTAADLEQEAAWLRAIGMNLNYA